MSVKGFRARLLDGVRSLANDEYDVRVGDPKNPADYAWTCAARMSRAPEFQGKRFSSFKLLENCFQSDSV